ncbi:MAG: DUF4411 family protein [Microbacteriaceae bacterium]|nr:DUF4411 family protein [Microbacteriaceae bacterium]
MYLLDANVFITAKNVHYGLDFVPAFWDWLDAEFSSGGILSIAPIKRELDAGADELTVWADARKPLFVEVDAATVPSFTALSAWVTSSDYSPAAQSTFLSNADYQIVAFAHAHHHVVVTHEKPEPNSYKRIKIPDACNAIGVAYINPFQMLRAQNARFVLPPRT